MQPKQYTFSDLTVGEIKTLIKTFFINLFLFSLVFGIPYAMFVGLDWGASVFVSEEQHLWLNKLAFLVLAIFIFWIVINNLPSILKQIGRMYTEGSEAAAKASLFKRAAWIIFWGGYFYSSMYFPLIWFWLTCAGLTVAFTYDKYTDILNNKTPKETTQDFIQ